MHPTFADPLVAPTNNAELSWSATDNSSEWKITMPETCGNLQIDLIEPSGTQAAERRVYHCYRRRTAADLDSRCV
jgi:hypothetical protein